MPLINSLYKKFRIWFNQSWPRIYTICNRRKSVVKFFFAGASAAAVDLLFLFLFYGILKWNLVLSTSLAFILSFAVSFTLQKFWTFRNNCQKKIPIQFVLYITNAVIGLNINGFLMHTLVYDFGLWYLLSQVIVNIGIGVYNFFVYKFIVFRNNPNEDYREKEAVTGSTGELA